MMRLIRSAIAAMLMVAAALAVTPTPAPAALPPGVLASNVHIFYYPLVRQPRRQRELPALSHSRQPLCD